jgi:hypothetical protein
MSVQELSYLREELNQRLIFLLESSSKTINHVLLMWIGALVLFNKTGTFLGESGAIVVGILLISNLMLFFSVQKDHESVNSICRLLSYLVVFYERKFIKDSNGKEDKDGDYSFWEITLIEEDVNRKKSWRILRYEYTIISTISTLLILVICLVKFFNGQHSGSDCIPYFVAIFISLMMTFGVFRNASLKYEPKKRKWLHFFLNYAIDSGYYTYDDIRKRFGEDFLKAIDYRIPKPSERKEEPPSRHRSWYVLGWLGKHESRCH